MKRALNNKGFTLLELMTVVGIVGILSAIGIPYYIGMIPDIKAKAAANDIAGALNVARMTAIATNSSATVKFNETADTYVFSTAYSSANTGWQGTVDIILSGLTAPMYTDIPAISDVTHLPERWVTFNSMGQATSVVGNTGTNIATESIYLKYKKVKSNDYRVTIKKSTGKISVEHWDGVGAWVQ